MDKKEKNLQETKQEIKRLLKEKNEDDLIELLNSCVNNEILVKEFEDKVPENYVDDILQGEKFEQCWGIGNSKNNYYWVSNLGRVAIGNEEKANKIIPQRSVEDNWYLIDDTKFKEIYEDFDGKLASNVKIYEYFMKKTDWLQKEKAEIQEIYLDCELELHHICKNGDNRIDNIIYLPKFIHDKVNRN